MRDFQGQLCFTNPVIMPLKILIVLAMFNCNLQCQEAGGVSTSSVQPEGLSFWRDVCKPVTCL